MTITTDEARSSSQKASSETDTQKTLENLENIAEDAYVFGYPLVLMAETRRQMTNVPEPMGMAAPINQFVRPKEMPDAEFRAVIRPNVDTLYATSFLDVTREPIVVHLPDTAGRYYLTPMLDAYTNVFAVPGSRTTGTEAHDFAIVGPGWSGELPERLEKLQAPTNLVWIINRTQLDGKADLRACVALNEQFTLTPLSAFGRPYTPPRNQPVDPSIDPNVPPPEVVARMDAHTFFGTLAKLMQDNPPATRDREALDRFLAIGLAPGRFAPSLEAATAIERAVPRALTRIAEHVSDMGGHVNGWLVTPELGEYGTRYDDRATVALVGLGANLAADALYPLVDRDEDGELLDGRNYYVLHFDRGQVPPVNAFWSITMYDTRGYFVPNPLDRYALGSRDPLRHNPDGSLDVYLQASPPSGELAANWLPAPEGKFNLVMRLYWPKDAILNGYWEPPPIAVASPTQRETIPSPPSV
jgi:hypothetical protein